MNNDLSSITFCRRINKLVMGFDLVKLAMQEKKVFVIILANDLSEKTVKEMLFLCDKYEIPHKKTDIAMSEFEHALGKRVGVLAISDENFAKKFL